MLSETLAAKITATITAAEATAYGMVLADLQNPRACLPPGFSGPVGTALGLGQGPRPGRRNRRVDPYRRARAAPAGRWRAGP